MRLTSGEARARWALAIVLALIAGYVDGYGLRFLGTYVSFMSGNTTLSGVRMGQGNFHAALPFGVAIACFVIGSFLGNLLTQSRWRYSHRLVFGLIAILLATAAGLERHSLMNVPSEIAALSLAMGMMNPAVSEIGAESIGLTFMTGMLNRIGGHLAAAALKKTLPGAQGPGDSHLVRVGVVSSLWSAFLAGAMLSGLAHLHFRNWGLLVPCLVMIALGLFTGRAASLPGKALPVISSVDVPKGAS